MKRFTLVEMLMVVAIIAILAGLVIPAVAIGREKGKITQAQSGITALKTALNRLNDDYGKILKKDGSNDSTYKIGNQEVKPNSDDVAIFGDDNIGADDSESDRQGSTYYALIGELLGMKNNGPTLSVNKRRRQYLEPQNGFDPTEKYYEPKNIPYMWQDPWGNNFIIYIKVTMDDELALPGTSKTISGNIAIYSRGPNGDDDKGCNLDLDSCFKSSGTEKHKQHDDIASWNM